MSPLRCWESPPLGPHSLCGELGYSSSPAATPVSTDTKGITNTHLLTSDLCSDITLPTLKSSSTMKSQPIRSKRPRRRSSLDLTAKKHCVMICCIRLWRKKIHQQCISNISYFLSLKKHIPLRQGEGFRSTCHLKVEIVVAFGHLGAAKQPEQNLTVDNIHFGSMIKWQKKN